MLIHIFVCEQNISDYGTREQKLQDLSFQNTVLPASSPKKRRQESKIASEEKMVRTHTWHKKGRERKSK